MIGVADVIGTDTLGAQISYVALGHLHRAQQFDGGRIRYSGSPIPLSFAEASYKHQILKLTFEATQLMSAEEIAIPRTAMLLRIPPAGPAPIDDVLARIEALKLDHALPLEQYPFVEVRVTEEGPDPLRRRRIEQAMEGKPLRLASIKVESANRDANADVVTAALQHFDLKTIDPEDIFQGAWREKYGNDPDMRVLEAFREILLQEARG